MQGFTARSTGAQAAAEPARTGGQTAVARGGGEGGGESGGGGNTGTVRRGGGGRLVALFIFSLGKGGEAYLTEHE